MCKYNNAPLPFQGQKRSFVKKFKQALNGFENKAVYVDLFGGSGLLSHTVKSVYPDAQVVWNDYDNYQERLKRIPETNELLSKLRPVLVDIPIKQRVISPTREKVLEVIKQHEKQYNYLDYVTLSSNILFSMKYAGSYDALTKETLYNRVRISDYNATGYLQGVERLQDDYKTIYQQYKDVPNVVFLVDPPYLSTNTSTYTKGNYWRMRDYLDVLNVLDGHNYVYFTSNKSEIVELCEWIETRTFSGNPFQGSVTSTTQNITTYHSGYTDIMLYKYQKSPD